MARVAAERTLVALWVKLEAVIAQVSLATAVPAANRGLVVIKALFRRVSLLSAEFARCRRANELFQQTLRNEIAAWVDFLSDLLAFAEMRDVVLRELFHL